MSQLWYTILEAYKQDTPALIMYQHRIEENIEHMLAIAGSASRLRPHIKTHKTAEIIQLMMDRGIHQFKCATIAEAELLGTLQVPDVLMAYQPFGPKIDRLLQLQTKYPRTTFSTLVDNDDSLVEIADKCELFSSELDVFIDINVGMNRTGIGHQEAAELYMKCVDLDNIHPRGLHIYDGHLRDSNYVERSHKCNHALKPVMELGASLENKLGIKLEYVVGGTPSFPVHAQNNKVQVSPGTCVLWDAGYDRILPDQDFLFGALVVTRVISKLPDNQICLDLGHKSIAAENPFPRLKFLNLPEAEEIAQSEEHLVVSIPDNATVELGDLIYGVPIHICPTCALYERAIVIKENRKVGEWKIVARDRKITI